MCGRTPSVLEFNADVASAGFGAANTGVSFGVGDISAEAAAEPLLRERHKLHLPHVWVRQVCLLTGV